MVQEWTKMRTKRELYMSLVNFDRLKSDKTEQKEGSPYKPGAY
jgi:hypothetical protein